MPIGLFSFYQDSFGARNNHKYMEILGKTVQTLNLDEKKKLFNSKKKKLFTLLFIYVYIFLSLCDNVLFVQHVQNLWKLLININYIKISFFFNKGKCTYYFNNVGIVLI